MKRMCEFSQVCHHPSVYDSVRNVLSSCESLLPNAADLAQVAEWVVHCTQVAWWFDRWEQHGPQPSLKAKLLLMARRRLTWQLYCHL